MLHMDFVGGLGASNSLANGPAGGLLHPLANNFQVGIISSTMTVQKLIRDLGIAPDLQLGQLLVALVH